MQFLFYSFCSLHSPLGSLRSDKKFSFNLWMLNKGYINLGRKLICIFTTLNHVHEINLLLKKINSVQNMGAFFCVVLLWNAPRDQVAYLPIVKAITECWAHNHYNGKYNLTLMWFFIGCFLCSVKNSQLMIM